MRATSGLTLPLSFLILLAIGWEIMARRLANPLVPGVGEVCSELADILLSGLFFTHMVITLGRVALGFLLAFVVSLALGILMGRNRYARQFFEPAILIGLTSRALSGRCSVSSGSAYR